MGSRSMKNRPSAKKKHPVTGVAAIFTVLGVLIVSLCVGALAVCASWLQDLPDYKNADAYSNDSKPTVVYAADETTELARFQLEYRETIEFSQMSPYVLKGTVATEDERFYDHGGIDIAGIARAVVNNLTGGALEGASTITQQLVRNTVLADEMDDISIKRKVREAYVATKLEEQYSKDEILAMYLNTINYGSGAYGIEAASQRYFSKSCMELTLPEAALLIGIPQSPTYNDPINYPDNALKRRNVVLDRMLSNGYITQTEHDQAVAEPINLNVHSNPDDGILAYPYFTSYVRNLLYNSYNLSSSDILEGGLSVYTTLDVEMQDAAEAAAQNKRDALPDGIDCAMAVVEPSTGYVKAIVGGADYYTNQVNIATGDGAGGRPCGSAFKVFTLVTALDKKINPQSYIDCTSPATVDGYTVQNCDNINYGTRTITRALAVSSNTGFVRLISSIGVNDVAQMAKAMGISSELSPHTAGATLTLGVENVTPLEMAEAFATIANGGVHCDSTPIMRIEDRNGKVLVDNTDVSTRSERVISEEVAYAAEQVMESVVNSSEGTGTAARLASGQVVAGKTGTTESYKDITFFGIIPQLSVGIWCGDPSNVSSVPVGTECAGVFSDFVNRIISHEDVEQWKKPSTQIQYVNYTDKKYHIYGTNYVSESASSSSSGSSSSSSSSSASASSDAATAGGNAGATTGGGGATTSGNTGGGGTTGGGGAATGGGATGTGPTGGGAGSVTTSPTG